ncbi:hypothetical protein [Rufibacter sp. XAAS-G3-1]|uniref:hypothetical protein n=1 Tax=Rufibacter sp. XAAS-G3-1 TaxID=2729134 RepID=UPI0015E77B56|nr:hypothetical protein [Rufibacter sp. XAAS-G3-1]
MIKNVRTRTEITEDAIDALTHRPAIKVSFATPPKNLRQKIDRLLGRHQEEKVYLVGSLKVGTVLRISAEAMKIPDDVLSGIPQGHELDKTGAILPLVHDHLLTLVEIIALALTDTEQEPEEELRRLIRREFDMPMVLRVLSAVCYQVHLSDFSTCIVLTKSQNALPKVNPENGTGERIARGH